MGLTYLFADLKVALPHVVILINISRVTVLPWAILAFFDNEEEDDKRMFGKRVLPNRFLFLLESITTKNVRNFFFSAFLVVLSKNITYQEFLSRRRRRSPTSAYEFIITVKVVEAAGDTRIRSGERMKEPNI